MTASTSHTSTQTGLFRNLNGVPFTFTTTVSNPSQPFNFTASTTRPFGSAPLSRPTAPTSSTMQSSNLFSNSMFPAPSTAISRPSDGKCLRILMNTKEGIVQGPINNPYSYIPHRNGEPKDVTYCGDDESQGAWRERIRCIRERPGCRCYTVNSALNEEGEWEEVDVKERRRMWKAGRFSQWGKMPPELKIRVLEICDVPDAVCLSLASKEMHELAAPVLAKYDKPAALDKRYAMRSHGHTYTQQNFLHTYSTNIEPSKIIRPYWCTSRHCVGTRAHCSCISCPLFTRLETWVNSTFGSKSNASHKLKFCPGGNYSRYGWNSAGNDNCRRFTWRRKERRFLCTHGTPHVGKKALWPLNMRGDYHNCQKNKYWKKGYTETNMRRAMDRYKEEREDVGGYSLRKKPRPTVRRREHVYQRMRGRGEDGDEDEDEDVEMSD